MNAIDYVELFCDSYLLAPVRLGTIIPDYVWVKKLKLNSLKKLFSVTLTTFFLVGFNLTPAQAATTVSCSGGGSFTYTGTTVDGNSGLTCVGTAVIPNTILLIDTYAFAGATGLTAVTIGTGVTRINDYAFNNTRLSTVSIPNNVQTLGNGVFETSPLLTTVTIGTGLTAMGAYTFGNTSGALTSVTFEGNAPTVGTTPFYDGAANAKAIIKFTATGFGVNGSNWNGLTVSMNRGTISCSTAGSFTIADYEVTGSTFTCAGAVSIPSGVTSIGFRAFQGLSNLETVVIPDSVLSIGEDAFESANGLLSVTIGNGVTYIGTRAFANTDSLSSVTFGSSVANIDDSAFQLTQLTSVTLPISLTRIGHSAFDSSALLRSVTFLGNAPTVDGTFAFFQVATGATANITTTATGFPANGLTWNGLIVSGGSEPDDDSGSSSTTVATISPTIVKTADAVFNLKNKKYLSKDAMKTKLSKNKSFKRVPEDLYKYSIFKESKKMCAISGNKVTSLKKTGTCDLYATRTTTKGAKYKYWVQINYTK